MLGFSLQKILLLIGIIGAVWYGFKLVSRLQEARDGGAKPKRANPWRKPAFMRRQAARPAAREQAERGVEDMVQCPKCKAYVAAGSAHTCDKSV